MCGQYSAAQGAESSCLDWAFAKKGWTRLPLKSPSNLVCYDCMNVLLVRNPWTENIRHTGKASPVCMTKEFLPTTGLGSGPGTGTDACLVSAISNTEITSRLVYIFCNHIEH